MFITVFTPTYNRAYCLETLYKSLCNQTFKDFEWLIVDDGSSDNTKDLVEHWKKDNIININFMAQPNGGKHRAINRGVKNAKGIFFFIVDSDDMLPPDSLAQIHIHYIITKDRKDIGGVCGLKAYYDGRIIGGEKNFNVLECSAHDIRYKYKVKGDLAEVFYTSIMAQFPFPEIDNERFCPEGLIWNRISSKYNIHYFNKPIYYCEYLNDGLTSSITKVRVKSPVGTCLTYAELVKSQIPFLARFRAAINFWRFRRYIRKDIPIISIGIIWIFSWPFSLPFYFKDAKYK